VEAALVRRFLEHALDTFARPSEAIALFCEPRLEIGYPDIVITVFDPRHYDHWSTARAFLEVQDLKILQHLHTVGSTDTEQLSLQLGLPIQDADFRLAKLHDARLVRCIRRRWAPYSLRRSYGIKRLIAIEAKINNWRAAFHQATMNRWFASETYILSPVAKPSRRVLERAKAFGVGIYTCSQNGVVRANPSVQSALPACYASWLFNEWIGRSLNSGLV